MVEIISPEELAKAGFDSYQRGDYQSAACIFEEARQGYIGSGDELNAAEMANNCAIAYLKLGEAATAWNLVEGTHEMFALANDHRRQGMALGNLATILEALDRFDEAIDVYQQSAKCLQESGEDQLYADVMRSLSSLQLRTGHQLQALTSMRAGLEGIHHPNLSQRLTRKLIRIPFDLINKNTP